MTISERRLAEFIAIWEHLYGEHLSAEEARPIATQLAGFYRLIMRQPPEEPALSAQSELEAA